MKSLLALQRHLQDERDRAAAAWQAANNAQLAIEAQYEQLLAYRREYETRWSHQFSTQGEMELVRSYHGFMLRLTQAVEHQHGTVQSAGTRAGKARAQLREREMRVAAVCKLIERRAQQGRVATGRREQKFNDEMAARELHDSAFQHGSTSRL
ncbi:MAG: flagellar export protein FliJ [Burkholderiaceae bacterium]